MMTMTCKNGLPRVEVQGQYSADYGHTYCWLGRDTAGNVVAGLGGLSREEAERQAAEWLTREVTQ